MNSTHISPADARKLALQYHGLGNEAKPRGLNGTLQVIERLGYVQIDTISVMERAHHHTLYNRVRGYRREHLDQLLENRRIFEYWAHAAAYLPIADYRYCLPRMNAIAAGQRHWYKRNEKLMKRVLERIREDGPMAAGDFEDHRNSGGMWEWSPVKQAIEHLFMQGALLVTRRESFRKIFDLTERVLPVGINTSCPNDEEYGDHLVDRYVGLHGIVQGPEPGYLRKGYGEIVRQALVRAVEDNRLVEISVGRQRARWYAAADFETRLQQAHRSKRARLLSPFDNLVIQRDRIRHLFGFDYQIECYLPAAKRKHGYYCLPILWRDRLIGRLDGKSDRKSGEFLIHKLQFESLQGSTDDLIEHLVKAVNDFAAFTGCERVVPAGIHERGISNVLKRRFLKQATIA